MPKDPPLHDKSAVNPAEQTTLIVTGPPVVDPVASDAVVVTEPLALTGPAVVDEPVVGPDGGESVIGSHTVAESKSTVLENDGTVATSYQRVEEETVVAQRRPNWFWPLLALIALALIAGLVAWWYFSNQDSKQVPNVVGSSLTTAVNRLQQADFKSSISRSTHPEQAGIVFAQNPAASTKAKKGSVVQIAVSNGPGLITVPSAVGLTDVAARQALVNAGLQVTEVRVFSGQAPGTVIAQNPTAGDKVASNQRVRINVSKGTRTAVVPNAVGLSDTAARNSIVSAGFRATETRVPSTQPTGTVIAQSPAAGSHSASGSIIRINVAAAAAPTTTPTNSTGTKAPGGVTTPATNSPAITTPASTAATTTSPTTTTAAAAQIPTVSGTLSGAAQTLEAAGFRVSVAYVPGTAALGTVIAQNPPAGASAPTGSHVTVNLSAGPGKNTPETVPDVVGKTIPEGVAAVNQAGLRLIFLRVPVTNKTQAGTIIEQTPASGTTVPKNGQILVYMGAYQR